MLMEWIGIDVIFGGFILGVILLKNINLSMELVIKIEDFVFIFFLFIFFVYSGLSIDFGLFNKFYFWVVCVLVVVVAIVGKYCGVYVIIRVLGVEK